jgi:hypothetical protein
MKNYQASILCFQLYCQRLKGFERSYKSQFLASETLVSLVKENGPTEIHKEHKTTATVSLVEVLTDLLKQRPGGLLMISVDNF